MTSSQIKKNNINELSQIFKEKILLNPYRIENLKKFAMEGELNKELLRPIAWKIFLGVLPNTTSLREWVEIVSNQREEFKKKIKKFCKIKKFIGDPLGGGSKKKKATADTSYEDTDLKNLINKDLDRTHQEIDLFLQNKIKNILANVLYIWSKENHEISYRQGMNELLAILFLVFYPYYFPCTRKPKNTKNDIIEFLKDMELYKEDIYIFFHDEEEIQSDLFFIFEALMKKGMSNLFNPKVLNKDDPGYKMYEIFPQMWKDDSDEDKPTYVYRRCALLIKEKLKSLDNDLYSHFKRIDLNCGVFLQRWLRCIFCREFSLDDVYLIWDIILYDDYINGNTQKYSFIYMEYLSIAMIFKIRDTLKDADQNECFTTLFKYPETNDIMEIIKLSKKVEQAINERLNGKNSNVYDILGIMKPIESEPTRIFTSPHMFNQSGNKNSQNNNNDKVNNNKNDNNFNQKKNNNTINNNTININNDSENQNDNNEENNITYTPLDVDEKENINLDSINHNNQNNGNDIGSQAKSFFNSALNSLTNFGGIIKDQLQNAKDSVIDSFTGNDNNYNNYEDNYQENNDYYYNNSNYNNSNSNYNNSNSNYNNSNSNYNNSNSNYNYNNNDNYNNNYNNNSNNNNTRNDSMSNNNRKLSNEKNDESQNSIERKASVDSGNELTYNRQDIIDIVNKMKEFDTRYNMFFNEEDKKNFRIIIDYLKAKI